jgi:glyoxylase-like metal-dependent hydrolase (beta-lactamase superfamily II)
LEWDGRLALIEAGVGAFLSPKLRERFGVVQQEHQLLSSLADRGVGPHDIEVVVLSHLHFDHAGGLLSAFSQHKSPELAFARASFLVTRSAWERARKPHPRDRASFIEPLPKLLLDSGRLNIVEAGAESHELLGSRVRLRESYGHTPGMLIPTFLGRAKTATFCADMIPGAAWVHAPLTMGYDRYPEKLVDEKLALYESMGLGSWLLFTHDPHVAAGCLSGTWMFESRSFARGARFERPGKGSFALVSCVLGSQRALLSGRSFVLFA